MRLLLILVLGGFVFAGCRHTRPPSDPLTEFKPKKAKTGKPALREAASQPAAPQKPLPRVTPLNEFSGKVASVNAALRFAVLDFYLTQLPPIDQLLSVYRQGQKVGEVKISGPVRDNNIVADITAGEAQVGDEVRGN